MPNSSAGKRGGDEAPAAPEERALPFVAKPNPKAIARINREMRQRMYLMGKRIKGDARNPAGVDFYVMGEIGKIFTVKIRDFPSCHCGDFLLTRLCKHMVFVSSRVLRLNQDDPLIWQRALVPSEIKRVIQNPAITPVKPKSKFKRLKESFSMGYGPHDILEHAPMYCPVCCEEVNFFEEKVYEREESLLEELYKQNMHKSVTSLKAKLDTGTPKRMQDKRKKITAPSLQAVPTPAPPPTPALVDPPPLPADSPSPPGAEPAEEQKEGATPSAPPLAAGGEEGAALEPPTPPPPPEETAAAGAGGEAKPADGPKPPEDPLEPKRPKTFETLLFCPQKSCEFEGCVKVVHRKCWLKWGRFHKVDWKLPNIVQVNNTYPLASICH